MARRRPSAVVSSGYEAVNSALGGGFTPGTLVYLRGQPGVGKTTLALGVCREMHAAGRAVLYGSTTVDDLRVLQIMANRVGAVNIPMRGGDSVLHLTGLARRLRASLLVVDALQGARLQASGNRASGSIAEALKDWARSNGRCCVLLLGHLNRDTGKQDDRAVHAADVVLDLSHLGTSRLGDKGHELATLKNRCAKSPKYPTLLVMTENGFVAKVGR